MLPFLSKTDGWTNCFTIRMIVYVLFNMMYYLVKKLLFSFFCSEFKTIYHLMLNCNIFFYHFYIQLSKSLKWNVAKHFWKTNTNNNKLYIINILWKNEVYIKCYGITSFWDNVWTVIHLNMVVADKRYIIFQNEKLQQGLDWSWINNPHNSHI